MKDGQSCWMIERRYAGEDVPIRYLCFTNGYDSLIEWAEDVNKGLHFADRESADQMCGEMPEDWDVHICEHAWMDKIS